MTRSQRKMDPSTSRIHMFWNTLRWSCIFRKQWNEWDSGLARILVIEAYTHGQFTLRPVDLSTDEKLLCLGFGKG